MNKSKSDEALEDWLAVAKFHRFYCDDKGKTMAAASKKAERGAKNAHPD